MKGKYYIIQYENGIEITTQRTIFGGKRVRWTTIYNSHTQAQKALEEYQKGGNKFYISTSAV